MSLSYRHHEEPGMRLSSQLFCGRPVSDCSATAGVGGCCVTCCDVRRYQGNKRYPNEGSNFLTNTIHNAEPDCLQRSIEGQEKRNAQMKLVKYWPWVDSQIYW